MVVGVTIAAAVLGGWWLIDRLSPVPSALVGEWENETPILAAGPGEVRLTIRPDGSAVVAFDRERYVWWGSDRFRCRVRGREVVIRAEPDGKPFALQIEVEADRFRVWDPTAPDPDRDALVFRRSVRRE